jgi:hypothetical protein
VTPNVVLMVKALLLSLVTNSSNWNMPITNKMFFLQARKIAVETYLLLVIIYGKLIRYDSTTDDK